MKEIIEFLRELHAHNEREWFDAHRTEWKLVQTKFNAFTEELVEGIASFDSSVRGLSFKDCTYRIYRDTRFSADKTPYKNHIGAYIAPRGKKSGYAGYYFHIEPGSDGLTDNHLLSAGLYCPEPPLLRSVRDEILDNGAEIATAICEAEEFTLNEDNKLKRTPKGFPAGSEFDELLKQKDLYLTKGITEDFLLSDDLLDRTLTEFRRTHHFIEIVNRAVRFAYEEMI
ncbi:MAG: DUF2461 domain-containing protein [Alistipes sp.]